MTIQHDKDIWIGLLSFENFIIPSFDGTALNYGTTMEEDDSHIKKVLSTSISEEQIINFTEAALIRYFQPKYNNVYKYNFPDSSHKTYSECYDIDLNAVSVFIETDNINCHLFSPSKPDLKYNHMINFPLHSEEERKNMFNFQYDK